MGQQDLSNLTTIVSNLTKTKYMILSQLKYIGRYYSNIEHQ